jgi:hypothetical protein
VLDANAAKQQWPAFNQPMSVVTNSYAHARLSASGKTTLALWIVTTMPVW